MGLSKVASMGSLDIGAPNLGSLGNRCVTAATEYCDDQPWRL
jgi:hypothetical protein